jgi:hypothetical protein
VKNQEIRIRLQQVSDVILASGWCKYKTECNINDGYKWVIMLTLLARVSIAMKDTKN